MHRVPLSPERISVALGLCIVMLAAIPRYMVEGYETRQTLLFIALAIVVGAAAVQWVMLSVDARKVLPKLCQRLLFMLLMGALVMGVWHSLFTDWISWQVFISHAATCGLLFHTVSLWWAKSD